MKIRYKRTGGFANITRTIEIDSSELPKNLQRIVQSLQPNQQSEPLYSDEFFHELELADGRTIRCTDSQCPSALHALFDFLTGKQ